MIIRILATQFHQRVFGGCSGSRGRSFHQSRLRRTRERIQRRDSRRHLPAWWYGRAQRCDAAGRRGPGLLRGGAARPPGTVLRGRCGLAAWRDISAFTRLRRPCTRSIRMANCPSSTRRDSTRRTAATSSYQEYHRAWNARRPDDPERLARPAFCECSQPTRPDRHAGFVGRVLHRQRRSLATATPSI